MKIIQFKLLFGALLCAYAILILQSIEIYKNNKEVEGLKRIRLHESSHGYTEMDIKEAIKYIYKEFYSFKYDGFNKFIENIETYLEIEWHTPQEIDQPEAHYVKKENTIGYGDGITTPTNYWKRQLTIQEYEYLKEDRSDGQLKMDEERDKKGHGSTNYIDDLCDVPASWDQPKYSQEEWKYIDSSPPNYYSEF